MNIFVLDENPTKAAQMHADVHVRKMIVESAQMLSTAHRFLDGEQIIKLDKAGRRRKTWIFSDIREGLFYKSTHVNHPCSVWARESIHNYLWLFELYSALCDEYEFRFNKTHKSKGLIKALKIVPDNIPLCKRTPFAQAFDDEYKLTSDAIINYRNYYIKAKSDLLSYTIRDKPAWIG